MSFSSDTKNEITHVRAGKPCCGAAVAAGFIRVRGYVFPQGKNGIGVAMTTENPAVARYIKKLLSERFNATASLMVGESGFKKGRHAYELKVAPEKGAGRILAAVGGIPGQRGHEGAADERIYNRKCCRRSYLKGLFLGAGTVSEPEKGYDLEISCGDEAFAYAVRRLMNSFTGIHARVRERRGDAVVYLKNAEQIKDMLNIIGAYAQLLKFENAMVLKDVRNRANRINNCDNANLDRALGAANRQISEINRIRASGRMDELPDRLLDMALVRLEHPEASLTELGELVNPPIGKSAVCDRLRKISAFAACDESHLCDRI
jgi:DNA-binding protein WhiA